MSDLSDAFLVLFPEFDGVEDPDRIDAVYAQVTSRLNVRAFGAQLVNAGYLLTAHRLFLSPTGASAAVVGGAAGPVTSESTGSNSVSYANPGANVTIGSDAWYALSSYGLEFLSIRNSRAMAKGRWRGVG